MTGYAITQIEVTNPEDYKEYLAKVTDIVTKFGGEYLVRGGEFQCFEGKWKYPRTVVIKFPSYRWNSILCCFYISNTKTFYRFFVNY